VIRFPAIEKFAAAPSRLILSHSHVATSLNRMSFLALARFPFENEA
jgi:hypothetical protein